MTQRSILAGTAPNITIHVGTDVTVHGIDGERISIEAAGRWGLKLEHNKEGFKVEIGSSGQVLVPFDSNIKVYAGKNIEIEEIHGDVTAYAGLNVKLKAVARLVHASAGRDMDIDCQAIICQAAAGNKVKFTAGGDLRCHIRDLTSATLKVNDLGGYWEGKIGAGQVELSLTAGGDVTVVTDQEIQAAPPDYILGKISLE